LQTASICQQLGARSRQSSCSRYPSDNARDSYTDANHSRANFANLPPGDPTTNYTMLLMLPLLLLFPPRGETRYTNPHTLSFRLHFYHRIAQLLFAKLYKALTSCGCT
jgi:hypothetical protein